jgi:hypothetical protein
MLRLSKKAFVFSPFLSHQFYNLEFSFWKPIYTASSET